MTAEDQKLKTACLRLFARGYARLPTRVGTDGADELVGPPPIRPDCRDKNITVDHNTHCALHATSRVVSWSCSLLLRLCADLIRAGGKVSVIHRIIPGENLLLGDAQAGSRRSGVR